MGQAQPARRGAHALQARALCFLSLERERAQWRYFPCAHAQVSCSLEAAAGMSEHGRAPSERAVSLAQCASAGYVPTPTSAAGRAHVASARAGPRPKRERARGAQVRYTRKPPREVKARAGTWEHGLAQQERRLHAPEAPFHSSWSECRQSGAARARVGSARAGPRPKRERAQWRARALHAQATSPSEGQGWHVGARPCAARRAASRSCSALP